MHWIDPDSLPETTGVFDHFLLSPHGRPDGLILQDGREVLAKLKAAGLDVPVVVGGIIPPADAETLKAEGVAAIYTPKDFAINAIIRDIAGVVEKAAG